MGAIQGTINTMLGTTAALAVGAEKMKEANEEKIIEGTEAIPKLKEQIAMADKGIQKQQSIINNKKSKKDAIEMAQLALQTLEGQKKADTMRLQRTEQEFKRAGGVL